MQKQFLHEFNKRVLQSIAYIQLVICMFASILNLYLAITYLNKINMIRTIACLLT